MYPYVALVICSGQRKRARSTVLVFQNPASNMLSLVQVLDHLVGFSSFVGMDRPRWLHTKGMILAQVEPVQNPIILAQTWCQVGLAANASAVFGLLKGKDFLDISVRQEGVMVVSQSSQFLAIGGPDRPQDRGTKPAQVGSLKSRRILMCRVKPSFSSMPDRLKQQFCSRDNSIVIPEVRNL